MQTTDRTEADKYLRLLNRVEKWERSASGRLREQILVPLFSGNLCCLHNWMINYETGIPTIDKSTYDRGRYYNWKQQQIWDTSRRLSHAFYSRYLEEIRKTW